MTALERAEEIGDLAETLWDRFTRDGKTTVEYQEVMISLRKKANIKRILTDATHAAIVEHAKAEVERVEARLRKSVDTLEEIECGAGQCNSGHGGCDAACKEFARSALRAIEGQHIDALRQEAPEGGE